MKVLIGMAAVCMMAVLSGCQLGISEEEVDSIVAQEIAESEERTTLKLRAERNWKLTDLTDKLEKARAETDDLFDFFEVLAESDAQTKQAIEDSARALIKAICSTNYTTTLNYLSLFWLIDHLQGGEITLQELADVMNNGIKLDETYASSVCNVDDERRWYLLELPDKLPPD